MSKKPPNDKSDHEMEDNRPPTRERSSSPPPPDPHGWNYLPEYGLVAHLPSTCNICRNYLNHTIEASMTNEPSYVRAQQARSGALFRREDKLRRNMAATSDDLRRSLETRGALMRRVEQLEEELARE